MQMKQLFQAAGVLLAASLAGQALALTPTTVPDFTLYTSGASAQTKTIKAMFNSYCNADLHTYQDQPWDSTTNAQVGTALGGAWNAYFCTFKSDATVTDINLRGKKVLVINRAKGGSVWGVVPVEKNMPVEEMNIFRAGSGRDCTLVSGTATAGAYNCKVEADNTSVGATRVTYRATGTALEPTLNSWECTIGATALPLVSNETTTGTTRDTVCRSSHGGISDVEPAMFATGTPNRPAFPAAANALPTLTLTSKPAYGVVFGVSVGNDVYDQLQTNQNLIAADGVTRCDGLAVRDRAIGSSCQPSLSKAEVTAIFAGDIKNWGALGMGNLGGGFGDLVVCRRVVGSGTQAGANAYFTENPCRLTGKRDFVKASATDGNGYTVVEGSGSGNVVACHNAAFAGTIGPDAPGILGVTGSIGIQGLEKLPGASDNWSYVRINGVAPTVANYLNGTYDYAFENTIQRNSSLVTTSLEGRLLTELQAQAPNPTFLKSAGVSGVASLCGLNFTVSPGTATTAPVTRMTRGGNSCAAATVCP